MRLLLTLIALFSTLHAQETSGRTCRVLFLGAAESDPEKLHLHDGATTREIDLPRLNLSRVYELPSGPLTLRLLTAPPVENQAPDPASPSIAVGENTGDFYLLLSPDPSNKTLPIRMQIIDAHADRFKSGQMLWYNLTPHDVGGQVGSQKLAIKPRSRVILDPPASGREDYNVNLAFRIAGKDTLYPLCETRWNHDPTARTVLFIINEAGSRAPRVLGFPDHR